jgi:hypothetical protein
MCKRVQQFKIKFGYNKKMINIKYNYTKPRLQQMISKGWECNGGSEDGFDDDGDRYCSGGADGV